MKKLAFVLCLAMLLSILPASALAADTDFAAVAEEALRLAEEVFPNALASEDAEELYASAQEYSRRYTAMLPEASYGDMQKALQLYLKEGRVKLELGLCRGKHLHDKRDSMARRDTDREIQRALRNRQK